MDWQDCGVAGGAETVVAALFVVIGALAAVVLAVCGAIWGL